jgi:hypothetical protein
MGSIARVRAYFLQTRRFERQRRTTEHRVSISSSGLAVRGGCRFRHRCQRLAGPAHTAGTERGRGVWRRAVGRGAAPASQRGVATGCLLYPCDPTLRRRALAASSCRCFRRGSERVVGRQTHRLGRPEFAVAAEAEVAASNGEHHDGELVVSPVRVRVRDWRRRAKMPRYAACVGEPLGRPSPFRLPFKAPYKACATPTRNR